MMFRIFLLLAPMFTITVVYASPTDPSLKGLNSVAAPKVEALFHPYDPTFAKAVEMFKTAESQIDIAMYNIDIGDNLRSVLNTATGDRQESNPVIDWIIKEETQKRLIRGDLKIRLIYEGYSSPEKDQEKVAWFEAHNVDVRHLNYNVTKALPKKSGKKMHHKFAIVDGNGAHPKLITGSANWSLGSRNTFNEAIMFFENTPHLVRDFQDEYNLLWETAYEVGRAHNQYSSARVQLVTPQTEGLEAHFNSENFKFDENRISKDKTKPGFTLTHKITEAIESADEKIEIATTRIKLRPVFNAIKDAVAKKKEQGKVLQVKIVVTMEAYKPFDSESQEKLLKESHRNLNCDEEDQYHSQCSSGNNFAAFLANQDYPGKEMVEVRAKFHHLSYKDQSPIYLTKQMHSKYMIIDDSKLLSGSFNWSYSAEFGHIENLIFVDGDDHPNVLSSFNADFDRLWSLNREDLADYIDENLPVVDNLESIESLADLKSLPPEQQFQCQFERPMTLTFTELDSFMRPIHSTTRSTFCNLLSEDEEAQKESKRLGINYCTEPDQKKVHQLWEGPKFSFFRFCLPKEK